MNYTVLDVETANADYASICQIGLVKVEAGEIASRDVTLIDPDDFFDSFNTSIHGISADNVIGAPTFEAIYPRLADSLRGQVVVHHGPFDRVSLTRACERYSVGGFEARWLDNQRVVRRTWEQFSKSGYSLRALAKFFGIKFKHHDALEDAIATHSIFSLALKETGRSVDDWVTFAQLRSPFANVGLMVGDGAPDGPFTGETIVFTGEMVIARSEAADIAKRIGFRVEDGVTKRTTALCTGVQNRTKLGGYEKSAKHRKAEALAASGQHIRILSEDDFWSVVPDRMHPKLKSSSQKLEQTQKRSLSVSLSLEDIFTEEELDTLIAILQTNAERK